MSSFGLVGECGVFDLKYQSLQHQQERGAGWFGGRTPSMGGKAQNLTDFFRRER